MNLFAIVEVDSAHMHLYQKHFRILCMNFLIQVESFDFYKMSKVILLFIWIKIFSKRIEKIIVIEYFRKVDSNIRISV